MKLRWAIRLYIVNIVESNRANTKNSDVSNLVIIVLILVYIINEI